MLLTGLQPGGKASKLLKQEKNQTKPNPKKTTQTNKKPQTSQMPSPTKKKSPKHKTNPKPKTLDPNLKQKNPSSSPPKQLFKIMK